MYAQELSTLHAEGYRVEGNSRDGWTLTGADEHLLMIGGHGHIAPTKRDAIAEGMRRVEVDRDAREAFEQSKAEQRDERKGLQTMSEPEKDQQRRLSRAIDTACHTVDTIIAAEHSVDPATGDPRFTLAAAAWYAASAAAGTLGAWKRTGSRPCDLRDLNKVEHDLRSALRHIEDLRVEAGPDPEDHAWPLTAEGAGSEDYHAAVGEWLAARNEGDDTEGGTLFSITRNDIASAAGREITDDEAVDVAKALENSSIPEAIAEVVDAVIGSEPCDAYTGEPDAREDDGYRTPPGN